MEMKEFNRIIDLLGEKKEELEKKENEFNKLSIERRALRDGDNIFEANKLHQEKIMPLHESIENLRKELKELEEEAKSIIRQEIERKENLLKSMENEFNKLSIERRALRDGDNIFEANKLHQEKIMPLYEKIEELRKETVYLKEIYEQVSIDNLENLHKKIKATERKQSSEKSPEDQNEDLSNKKQLESTLARLEKQKQKLDNTLAQMLDNEPSDKDSKEYTKWKEDTESLKRKISKVNKEIQDIKNKLKEYEQDPDIDKNGKTNQPTQEQNPPVNPSNGKNNPNRLPEEKILRRLPAEVEKNINKEPRNGQTGVPAHEHSGIEEIHGEQSKQKPGQDQGSAQYEKVIKKNFFRILADIGAAENAMSDAEVGRYQSATGKWLVPVQYDKGDWLHNIPRFFVQHVLGSMINIPRKIYSMIRTGKKQRNRMENLVENIEKLSPEDFETLIDGLEGYKGHESKVSAAVRTAAIDRYRRETNIRINQADERILFLMDRLKTGHKSSTEIKRLLEKEGLTEEERVTLENDMKDLNARNATYVREITELRDTVAKIQGGTGIRGLVDEDKASREGSNLSGRKLGKRFSGNTELEKTEAELQDKQDRARENGDEYDEVDAFLKHEDLLEKNTYTKNIMGITVSRSERNHSSATFHKEYVEDDLAKNIMTIAAVTATTINIMKQLENQRIIDQHNQEIAQANSQNQVMAAKGENLRQGVIGNDQVIKKGVDATNDTRTGTAWAAGHEHAGAASDFTNNWGSTQLDKDFHRIINGTVDDKTLANFINNGLPEIKKYAATYGQYDYKALINALQNLQNGGIQAITNYNTAMQALVQNAIQTGKIVSTDIGAISLSSTYIETMIPLVLAGKQATSREWQEAEREVAIRERLEKAKRKIQKENDIKAKGETKEETDRTANAGGKENDSSRDEEEDIEL